MFTRQQKRLFCGAFVVFVLLLVASVLPTAAPSEQIVSAQGPSTPTTRGASIAAPQSLYSLYLPLVMRDAGPLPPIIPPTTKPLTTDTTQYLTSVSADGVFTFTQMTPQLSALSPGHVIVGDVATAAPNGFLRKVNSVSSTGGQVIVQTTTATLEDAIQQGEAQVSRALTLSAVRSASYRKGVSLVRTPNVAQGSFYLQIQNVVLYDDDGNTATTNDQIVANGSVELSPSFVFNLAVKNWQLERLYFTTTASEKAELRVESKIQIPLVKREVELARFNLTPITVMIGPVPVVIAPVLTFNIGVDGSVHVGVSTGVTQNASWTAGLSYANGGWSPVSQSSKNFQYNPPTLSAGLDLKGYTGAKLLLLLYGTVGPEASINAYLKLEANPLTTPWWKLYGGLEAKVGVSIEILSHVIAGYEATVIDYKVLIAQASTLSAIATGGNHTCALMTNGSVKCWGDNSRGQLGDGTTTQRTTPVDVSGLTSGVSAIATGWDHTCALMTSGGIKCWGGNSFGQLGDGTTTQRTTPVDVSGLTSGVSAIATGALHTCALTSSGGVKCWGFNGYGQIGSAGGNRTAPVDVSGLASGVRAIDAGAEHTCALMASGSVKCWGYNCYGQLGDGTTWVGNTCLRMTPVDVIGLTSGVSAITAGTEHTCALMASDGVKCWGNNWFGQLGDGTGGSLNNFRTAPVDVSGLASGVSAIAAGHRHTCALMTSGGVKCWGRNYYGELGDGTTTDRYTPATVSGLTSGASAIATGGDITEETEYYLGGYSIGHTCALMADNGLKCWGYNHWGQLGDGTTTNRYTPVDVVGLGGATAMPINRSNVQR